MEKINDIVMLDIHSIVPNPYQPRTVFNKESIKELSQSIQQYGILQPITVRKADDVYELIMGERRFRAAQLINLKRIPAIVLDVGNEDSAVVALIENLQRVDLSYLEEADSYKKLIELHGLKQSELSEKIGKSQSTISNKLRLLKLSQPVMDQLATSNLSERHARSLLRLGDEKLQTKVLTHIIKNALNVKETEKYVEKVLMTYKKKHQNSTFKVNHRIYLNTIKKAFKMVKDLSNAATMDSLEHDEYIEITIKIPKE